MKYTHREIAFLTQHGKDRLLQPLFTETMGCSLVRATGYDTDQLGTFTRDLQRPGTQIAAARFKAHKAIELTGLPIGLGSEGTFGADPVGGLLHGIPRYWSGATAPANSRSSVWLRVRAADSSRRSIARKICWPLQSKPGFHPTDWC